MAKSIYTITDKKEIDVLHKGGEITLKLPSIFDDFTTIDDKEELLEWAESHDLLQQLMQAGLRDWIIKIRAIARPDEDTRFSDEGEAIKAQDRIDKMKFKLMTRPGSGVSIKVSEAIQKERDKMRQAMEKVGIPEEQIEEIINDIK